MSLDDGLLRLKMQNGAGGVLKAAKHNKRKLTSHKGADPASSHLNRILRGPATPEDVAALAKQLMSDAGIHKLKRKDSITAIEVVSSLPIGSSIDPMAYFPDFVAFIERWFGAHNILSADVHLDEAAPHCHILVLPLAGDKLDASGIVGGRDKVNELHTAFYVDCAAQYGLRRPPPRLSGNAKKTAAQLVIARLLEDSDAALVSGVWASVCEAIERFPEPFMADLGIQRIAAAKPTKTFEQYATSAGAGPKTAAGEASRDRRLLMPRPTPIGVEVRCVTRPLPCVGVGVGVAQFPQASSCSPEHAGLDTSHKPATPAESPEVHIQAKSDSVQPTPSPARLEQVTTRHRDADMTPDTWDGILGEHVPRRPAPTHGEKEAARAWVEDAPAGWSVAA